MNNNKGSILSVAFIVMAILTFSLTSLSVYTLRTIENTQRTTQNAISRNEAQRIISQAINDLRYGFEDDEGEIEPGLQTLLENDPDLLEDDEFEDNKIIDLCNKIEKRYKDEDGTKRLSIAIDPDHLWEDFEDTTYDGNVRAISFEFSYQHDETRNVVQQLHLTNHGVEFEEFSTFLFSMGTSANFVMNGGKFNYLEDEDEMEETSGRVFGGRIYENYQNFTYDSESDNFEMRSDDEITDGGLPINYPKSEQGTFITPEYFRCDFGAFEDDNTQQGCMDTDDGRIVMHEDDFSTISSTDAPFLDDLFMGFELQEHISERFEYFFNVNLESASYIDELSGLDLTEINASDLNDVQSSGIYTENGTPSGLIYSSDDVTSSTINLNDHALIIDGNLLLKDDSSLEEIIGDGALFITGDLIVDGAQSISSNTTVFVDGEVVFEFDDSDNHGITSPDFSDGFTLFSMGNIEILFSGTGPTKGNSGQHRSGIFMFTRQSILINASTDQFRFGGALYAQGLGEGLHRVQINPSGSNDLQNFHGIFLNSFVEDKPNYNKPLIDDVNGDYTIDLSEGESQLGEGDIVNPGSSDIYGFQTIGNIKDHHLDSTPIGDSGPGGHMEDLRESFDNIPTNYNTLVLYPGRYTYQLSTFRYGVRIEEDE